MTPREDGPPVQAVGLVIGPRDFERNQLMKFYLQLWVIAVLLWTSPSMAAPEAVNGWRQAKWGMSEAQVLKAFKGEAIAIDHPTEIAGEGRGSVQIPEFSISQIPFKVTFWFKDNHLTRIRLQKEMSNVEGRGGFRRIESMLREKYGPPAVDRSSDESDFSVWKTTWNLKGTNLDLLLVGARTTNSASLWIDYLKPTSDLNRL